LAHVRNTNSQYNMPEVGKNIAYGAKHDGVAGRFADPAVQKSVEVDLALTPPPNARPERLAAAWG
jgi:hypothetical protein